MTPKHIIIGFLAIAAIAIAVATGIVLGAQHAHGATVTCPSNVPVQRCIMVLPGHTGQQITDQNDCFHSTPWMVTDNNGALEAWMKCGSLYIGGKTGWLGGQICITEALTQAFCLTKADIQWIHSQDGGTAAKTMSAKVRPNKLAVQTPSHAYGFACGNVRRPDRHTWVFRDCRRHA